MSNEYAFFLYLLEKYAEYKNVYTADLLTELDETNISEYIMQMYQMYHTERIENAFLDIDNKFEEKLI
ncbi:MAG: DUF3791 domain-containing protein [Chitinivibrionia bacterium]|nr:DUF3791 domain-containing protein [Chitinivibrionia bacterium]